MQKVIEEGVTQRDCVIILGQRKATQRLREAESGLRRAMSRPGGLMQLAGGADLPVLGLRRAKWLNPSVAGV